LRLTAAKGDKLLHDVLPTSVLPSQFPLKTSGQFSVFSPRNSGPQFFYAPGEKSAGLKPSTRKPYGHDRPPTRSGAAAKTASDAAALRRTAAVVRNRPVNVANDHDVQSSGSQARRHCGFAARAGTLHADFAALHAVLIGARLPAAFSESLLRGVRRCPCARPLKPIAPAEDQHNVRPSVSGDGDLRVVERRSHVHDSVRHKRASRASS